MKIRWRQDKTNDVNDPDAIGVDSDSPASSWTTGAALKTMLLTGALWLAVAAGPLALAGLWVSSGTTTPARAAAAAPVSSTTEAQQAAEFAQAFTVAWLRATRGAEESVVGYLSASQNVSIQLPQVAPIVVEPVVVSVDGAGADTYQVVVSASVAQPPAVPVRRFYSVPVVRTAAGSFAAVSLPSPVAVTAAGAAVKFGYPGLIPSSSSAYATVTGFVSALLTGDTDVSRFSSPGSEFAAVVPPPYSAVTITRLESDRDISAADETPKTGARLRVFVTAAAVSAGGSTTVQYPLSLTGRDGRWEVAAVDPSPLFTVPTPTPTPAPPG